jgi:hypothetical protein
MRLTGDEFIRRFLLHTLPPGFQRIRHYGLLASRHKAETLERCRDRLSLNRELLPHTDELARIRKQISEPSILRCPVCQVGEMLPVEVLPPRPGSRYFDSS